MCLYVNTFTDESIKLLSVESHPKNKYALSILGPYSLVMLKHPWKGPHLVLQAPHLLFCLPMQTCSWPHQSKQCDCSWYYWCHNTQLGLKKSWFSEVFNECVWNISWNRLSSSISLHAEGPYSVLTCCCWVIGLRANNWYRHIL